MTTFDLIDLGRDLSSRERARTTRQRLFSGANKADFQVSINFDDVRTLTHSFIDELLAVVVQERGFDWFREHVRLRNLSEAHRDALLSAVEARLSSAEPAVQAQS